MAKINFSLDPDELITKRDYRRDDCHIYHNLNL